MSTLQQQFDELQGKRLELKQWLQQQEEEDEDCQENEEYIAKKAEAKKIKQQMKELQAQIEEEENEEEDEGNTASKELVEPETAAVSAEDVADEHALRTLNEWKVATRHDYKVSMKTIKAEKPSVKDQNDEEAVAEEEEKDKGSKKKAKQKKDNSKKKQQGPATGFICEMTAVAKKAKSGMFQSAQDSAEAANLSEAEAPVGRGEAKGKQEARRLAAKSLVMKLASDEFSSWGFSKVKLGEGGKSDRFAKLEAKKPKALNMDSGDAERLHPCLRVWGKCEFEDDCQYALFPYNTCLSFVKGKCVHGAKCVEPHDVDINDPKYQNNRPKPKGNVHEKITGFKRVKKTMAGDGADDYNSTRRDYRKSHHNTTGRGGYHQQQQQQGYNGGLPKGVLPEGLSCFHCGETTHLARDCPTAACYKCGEVGHMSRECPMADQESGGARGGFSSSRGGGDRFSSGRGGSGGGRGGGGAPSRGGRWGMEGRGYALGDANRPSKHQRLELDEDDE